MDERRGIPPLRQKQRRRKDGAPIGLGQNDGEFEREGQGSRWDALEGVQVAELEGHRSRSAVYLVHSWEGLGPSPCGGF